MKTKTTIIWFRQDLRLTDNPALEAAVATGGAVIPVFIWAPEEGDWALGGASRWWLHHSLAALDTSLRERGARLIVRRGESLSVLQALAAETGSDAVYWNRRYEPAAIVKDSKVKLELRASGIKAESFNASLLFEPWQVQTKAGKPFQVFTPFWKACLSLPPPTDPPAAPNELPTLPRTLASLSIDELRLMPKIDWAAGLREVWQPGEIGAIAALQNFLDNGLRAYASDRDRPDRTGSSRLSPYLHFGEIGPRQVWRAVSQHNVRSSDAESTTAAQVFLRELGWREFGYHLLYHFPQTVTRPLRADFAMFPWRDDEGELKKWQRGQTGYPFVDAGMRQLWATGWMHNRVRMVAASFLVKHLLLPWQFGAKWFWDTLVDADLANNTLGWQWVAGSGADAAPYFRIFNPVTQGMKFDPNGDYVRRWIPELSGLAAEWIHRPWEAPADALTAAGVKLGYTYPAPMIDHSAARKRALDALAALKNDPRIE